MATELLTIHKASQWATQHIGRSVTPSNIAYLLNYGRIPKYQGELGTYIRLTDLKEYYQSWSNKREENFKKRLGSNLNWGLSFEQYKEAETTKHVHRLHPYKGKFIPQLVEYFLDAHTDEFKKVPIFKADDIVLDPFCGSGTTLVQANELGIHAVGIDVSHFNSLITNLKLSKVNPHEIGHAAEGVERAITKNSSGIAARTFERALLERLTQFNHRYFPSPEHKIKVRRGEIDEEHYGAEKLIDFMPIYHTLRSKYKVRHTTNEGSFLDKWLLPSVRDEIESAKTFIDSIKDHTLQDMLRLILSRSVRSSRATTHYDLATLIHPVTEPYYCAKHGKICKPLFSMLSWWQRYARDTVRRLQEFNRLRTNTQQHCLTADARNADIVQLLTQKNKELATKVTSQKIRGIFSSPPYVGLIDYHEQHAYAYELYGYLRNDKDEIGPLAAGRGMEARAKYVLGIASVLMNCKQWLPRHADIFLVANDKFSLYPRIAEHAGMAIIQEYHRPVLNRAEGDKNVYSESIFQMRMR